MKKSLLLYLIVVSSVASCTTPSKSSELLLQKIDESGIDFENTITPNEEVNLLNFQYCYNGGGVGIGDFNQDGYPDVYFSGNQVSGELYLNKGSFKFEKITREAGLETKDWLTGVSIVDINSDGWEDIYLNVGGADCKKDCNNLLYVNQGINENGIPQFIEMAEEYGLDEGGYSQQTVFFDYDNDGDLDAFILTNGNVRFDKNSPMPKHYFPKDLQDVFLENVFNESLQHAFYTDRSTTVGVLKKGFGLGVGIHDFNNDGLIDIYAGNDFITNDLLYMNTLSNEGENIFNEKAATYLKHQTFNAMGLDLADLNQDDIPEIMVLDMLPEDYKRQKEMLGSMNYDKYELALNNDYTAQFMHNTLQVSQGRNTNGDLVYSEQGFMLNVAKTDWSWAPLFADFDLDGDLDLYVTNGYGKDITNLDFINYSNQNNVFGTEETRYEELRRLVSKLEPVKLKNYYFESKGGTQFEKSDAFYSEESLSNGAAYADLDLDGDLDVVVNNINQKAFILENTSESLNRNYLKVHLKGPKKNPKAIGAKITLWEQGRKQSHFQSRIKGYLSSVETGAVFGIQATIVDSIIVRWPSGNVNKYLNVEANKTVELKEEKFTLNNDPDKESPYLINRNELLAYQHLENKTNDYLKQPLLNTQHSKFGPALATASIANSNENYLFIGASHGQKSQIWRQKNNKFHLIDELEAEFEDTDAVFYDIDNDSDLDLIVGSGGNQYPSGSSIYQDRVYLNEDDSFTRTSFQPSLLENTSCIRITDFNKDGKPDFFFGSNIVPLNYPNSPKQGLFSLENNSFVPIAVQGLENIGMVKDALWVDYNNDGWEDLIIVGDWMEIILYKNIKGILEQDSVEFINEANSTISTHGWWKTVVSGDFDQDGDQDFVVGNKGINNFVNPTQKEPIYIYTQDYDSNGKVDPVMAGYILRGDKKDLYPLQSRDDIIRQLPKLKKKYPSYRDFSNANFVDLLELKQLKNNTLKATIGHSVLVENLGNGQFKVNALPEEAQQAPINDILVDDINGDNILDLILVGNDYYAEATYGRHDAFNGLLLKGSSNLGFEAQTLIKSGLYVPYQSNHIVAMKQNKALTVVAGQNNNRLQLFQYNLKNE